MLSVSDGYWIGVKRLASDLTQFVFDIGDVRIGTSFWQDGEPSTKSEKCVGANDLGWNDVYCNRKRKFLCEFQP